MWENKYSITFPRGAFYFFSTVAKRFLFTVYVRWLTFTNKYTLNTAEKNTETSSG